MDELDLGDVGNLQLVPAALGAGIVRLGRGLSRVHETERGVDELGFLAIGQISPATGVSP